MCLNRKRDETLPNSTANLIPIRSKDDLHSVVPPLVENPSSTPSYLTLTVVSSSRSIVVPTPHTSPLQLATKPLPAELASSSPTVRPSFLSGIFNSPKLINPPVPTEQYPVPVQTEPKPELPRSPVNLDLEEDPANRHPNNPDDSKPKPSDQEDEDDMADNNNGAVNKPNQFEGDKGKSKEFLNELYMYLLRDLTTEDQEFNC
ncbi:uncharacterized protein FIBRA_09184 [Fibroporia radiculosa]|uniref:Uncharacterized protein n=1 Tax=Fibroporia radiculosa TaxID=599839 RepID=J7SC45_9APHY|nr:uncharacterized protein FIBRA_09184 [Fibroporia radiculosa]CCM06876.1 predicted protein [Fibroporia radiculosa]